MTGIIIPDKEIGYGIMLLLYWVCNSVLTMTQSTLHSRFASESTRCWRQWDCYDNEVVTRDSERWKEFREWMFTSKREDRRMNRKRKGAICYSYWVLHTLVEHRSSKFRIPRPETLPFPFHLHTFPFGSKLPHRRLHQVKLHLCSSSKAKEAFIQTMFDWWRNGQKG